MAAHNTGISHVASSTPMPVPVKNGDSITSTSKAADFFLASPSTWDQSPTSTNGSPLSSLKNSFSMSSLSQHSQITNPRALIPNMQLGIFSPTVRQNLDIAKCERPFNSLTRVRDRGASRVQWRRSLGASPLQFKEDIATALSQSGSISQTSTNADWPALQADYTFLMSCDLIETCRSLNGEISGDFSTVAHRGLGDNSPGLSSNGMDATKSPNKSINPSNNDDVEPTTPDLHIELQILREWLKCMEQKVPKLVLRPKWTRDALERNIIDYKLLQREIEGRSAQFAVASQRCATWNPRFGRALENRYHRLLLRVLEWTFHLETLAKKPPEFWNGRRAAVSSEESEHALPRKCPRLDASNEGGSVDSSPHSSAAVDHQPEEKDVEEKSEMRSLNGSSGNLPNRLQPVPTSVGRANTGVYNFKHPDTDEEYSSALDNILDSSKQTESADRTSKDGTSKSVKETKWIYSPTSQSTDEVPSSDRSVRKKLDFDSEQESESSRDSLCRYSSSESDWLQSGGLELDNSDCEDDNKPESVSDELSQKDTSSSPLSANTSARVYDKDKVHKLVTEAEQMVSLCSDACRAKDRTATAAAAAVAAQELRYTNSGAIDASSECDASSELTSEGEYELEHKESKKSSNSGRKVLNRTYLCNEPTPDAQAVKKRVKQVVRPQRPVSLSGLSGLVAQDDGTAPRGASSETALNFLASPAQLLQPNQRLANHKLSPSSEGIGSSCLSSCCSSDKLRKRRPSARMRSQKLSMSRREVDRSTSSQTEEPSQKNEPVERPPSVASDDSTGGNESSLYEAPPVSIKPKVFSDVLSLSNSSPRSAPSDVEQVAHADETSNFSEQAWDNYLDRYASEAYSEEPPDAESARRLLEFGEDYRNDLDSLSDCPSSLSANNNPCIPVVGSSSAKRSPFWRRSAKGPLGIDRSTVTEKRLLDSDSDVDDFEHFLETSKSQLRKAWSILRKLRHSPRKDANQLGDLLATSTTNVECLREVLKHLKVPYEDSPNLDTNLKRVQELIDKWLSLDAEVSPLHQQDAVHRQLSQQLHSVKARLAGLEHQLFSIDFEDDFQRNIEQLHLVKSQLDQEKEALLQANIDVHTCVAHHPTAPGGQVLKENVAALYQLWDQLSAKYQERESQLEDAEKTWKELQKSLNDLQADIAADQAKLQQFTELPETDPSSSATYDAQQIVCPNWLKNWNETQLNIQCDSGISSGSDGEFMPLAEREKRLNTLKQLARKLENLSPGSAAIYQINRRLDKTRQDLQVLQNQLSSLPPLPPPSKPIAPIVRATKEISIQTDSPKIAPKQVATKSPRPYWQRIARLALPFQLAMVALLVAACVLEPSCCNTLNTFGSSFLPALKYHGGPPPI